MAVSRPADFRFTEAVRDPVWKHIYLTPGLLELTRTAEFTRLAHIKQLGPADIVYPGATHTRFSHSCGVYFLAVQLLQKLAERGASWITKTGAASFYAAALLHDLGHFPYAHSLKELPLASHEELTARLLRREPFASRLAKSGANPEQTAAIIYTDLKTADSETLFYRKLLSGVLDPDKLDYLNRDAYFCGVPYGTQDTDYILSRLIPDLTRGIVLESNAVSAVESLLFSKYLMYRAVYWHKTVRSATAMMKKSLYASLSDGILTPQELYGLDDEGLFRLLREKDSPAHLCALRVQSRQLYAIIAEIPFDETKAAHTALENHQTRTAGEQLLSEKAGIPFTDLLLDIPERISFESDLWITDENCEFSKSSTVFSQQTVTSFTASLRKIRLAVYPGQKREKKELLIAEFRRLYYNG